MSAVIPVERESEQFAKESRRYGRRIAEQRQKHRNMIRKGFSAFGQHINDDAQTIRSIAKGFARFFARRNVSPGPVCCYTLESAPAFYNEARNGRRATSLGMGAV